MSDDSGFVDVGGCRLYYRTAGSTDSPAFVMIHAGVADNTQWDDQVTAFADKYYVVRYDTRAWGQSFTEDVPFSNREDLLQLLDHLQIDKAIVMGCSRSGQIALDFALEFPDRVSGLIWVCGGISGFEDYPPPLPEEGRLFSEMEQAYEAKNWAKLAEVDVRVWAVGPGRDPAKVDSAFQKWMYDICLAKYTNHKHAGQAKQLEPPAAGRLSEIKVPTLLVTGVDDPSETAVSATYLANNIAGVVRVDIADTAHIPNRERPEEFNAAVRSFLEHSNL